MHETKHTSFYISVKAALDKTLFFFLFAVPGVDPRPSIGPWQRAITSLPSCHACVRRKANRTLILSHESAASLLFEDIAVKSRVIILV